MPGFTTDEAEIIANIARYHRKSHPKNKHENFQRLSEEKREIIKKLAGILRIAEGIDRRQIQAVRDVEVVQKNSNVIIRLIPAENTSYPDVELWGAERRKLLFEEVTGTKVTFTIGM
jgi:exopolyphosphatase/guanosine-5'-triphosphate,3'-diphosphate pyrophosphatase